MSGPHTPAHYRRVLEIDFILHLSAARSCEFGKTALPLAYHIVCCVVVFTGLGLGRLQHIRLHFILVRRLLLHSGIGISFILLPPDLLHQLNTSIRSICQKRHILRLLYMIYILEYCSSFFFFLLPCGFNICTAHYHIKDFWSHRPPCPSFFLLVSPVQFACHDTPMYTWYINPCIHYSVKYSYARYRSYANIAVPTIGIKRVPILPVTRKPMPSLPLI